MMFRFIQFLCAFGVLAFPSLQGQHCSGYGIDSECNLLRDLMTVECVDRCLRDAYPVMYNHLLQGGYWAMPSARMGIEGELSGGFSYVPPYRNYNMRCQLTDRLELSGNYRIFIGVEDPVLSCHGFGDFSDKGANLKFAIIHPEDSDYRLPGVAIGTEDFIGTRAFRSQYVVLTQVFKEANFECSIGIGKHRIHRWFGGFSWMPFRGCIEGLENFAIVGEYDATPYEDKSIEPHPDGRVKKTPWNLGVKWRIWDAVDLSASYIRGDAWAFSVSAFYNLGSSKGVLPKFNQLPPYQSPRNLEPLGAFRSETAFVHELLYPFCRQGFEIIEAQLYPSTYCGQVLRLHVLNRCFRVENDVREQLSALLAQLTPPNIDEVIVVIEDMGFPIQQYRFQRRFLHEFAEKRLCAGELEVLSPLQDVTQLRCYPYRILFSKRLDPFCIALLPKTRTFFGSAQGKFKYSLGVQTLITGYLPWEIYYSVILGYNFVSKLESLKTIDKLNPSQIINVRTDSVRYYQQKGITVDQAYLQKNWNLNGKWFARGAIGLFEEAYGGVATEFLWFPVKSRIAFGIEGALLRKRTYDGVGFTDKVRKLDGFKPTWRTFHPVQYFGSVYYEWEEAKLDLKVKAGRFLAKDYGVRYEVTRNFESGMRLSFWYTRTNGRDKVNGERYYDKGIAITLPLDLFYTCCSRKTWTYGMSAWLRDVGQSACTGETLYELIRSQRIHPVCESFRPYDARHK